MNYIVDYSLNDGETVLTETHSARDKAERRARYLSRKHFSGDVFGPHVYVYMDGGRGQRVFVGGTIAYTEGAYV